MVGRSPSTHRGHFFEVDSNSNSGEDEDEQNDGDEDMDGGGDGCSGSDRGGGRGERDNDVNDVSPRLSRKVGVRFDREKPISRGGSGGQRGGERISWCRTRLGVS